MKIIIEVPDSIIPHEVRAHINHSKMRKEETRAMIKALLDLAVDEFENCELGVAEYRLVMK